MLTFTLIPSELIVSVIPSEGGSRAAVGVPGKADFGLLGQSAGNPNRGISAFFAEFSAYSDLTELFASPESVVLLFACPGDRKVQCGKCHNIGFFAGVQSTINNHQSTMELFEPHLILGRYH